jgi:molecular chaperone Hsp33
VAACGDAAGGGPLASRCQVGVAGRGALRWVAADITGILREVCGRLDLTPVAAAALGRAVAGAAMLLRLATKTPSRLVLDIRGDGPLRLIMVEVDQDGNIRAMVGEPRVVVPDLPNTKLAVGAAVGSGLLRVLREFGDAGSYHSHVRLVDGEIGNDLAHYLAQSEQSNSAVLVGVLGRQTGVAAAGGVIVEVLPGAPEATVARLESNLSAMSAMSATSAMSVIAAMSSTPRLPDLPDMPPVPAPTATAATPATAAPSGVSWLLEEGGVERVLDAVLAGLDREILETAPLRYRCRCSRDRLQQHLATLSAEDRDYLAEEDGVIAADCVFCGNHYRFRPEELVAEGEAGEPGAPATPAVLAALNAGRPPS